MESSSIILWRPIGPKEFNLIRESGMMAFPSRLPEQPIFYPVLTKEYAIKIARDWNVPAFGRGYVTQFHVKSEFLSCYDVHTVGGNEHREYWIPSDDLAAFNNAIIGLIEIVAEFDS